MHYPLAKVIEVRVPELKRLFNSMDPSPFKTRDLDPSAEEFIVSSGKELPRDVPTSEAWLHPDGLLYTVLRESLVIGGWVAMWRPIEVFLYDRWPIRPKRACTTDSPRCRCAFNINRREFRRVAG